MIFMHNMENERAEISEPEAKLWADQNQWRELASQATVLDMVFYEQTYDDKFEFNRRVIEKIAARGPLQTLGPSKYKGTSIEEGSLLDDVV